MTHKQAREALLKIIKAPINANEFSGLYVTTCDININKLVSTDLGEVVSGLMQILDQYTEQKILEARIDEQKHIEADKQGCIFYRMEDVDEVDWIGQNERLDQLKSQLAKIKEGKS